MNSSQSVSVVLPAYNERGNIADTVKGCIEFAGGKLPDYEIIVVDDGSTDGTGALVNRIAEVNPKVRLVSHRLNRGYGSALKSGFEAAGKDYIFLMDSDGQFDIRDIENSLSTPADSMWSSVIEAGEQTP